MNTDTLKQFISLRKSLIREKARLEQEKSKIEGRLMEIDTALGESISKPSPRKIKGEHAKNPMSLKEAVVKVTSARPMTKAEILAAVQELGYRFRGKNPKNSLNVLLYGKNPKFKSFDGRFSPVKS